MASLISCAEAGFEPIHGYVLREKLGAGGYGEVWLADAPGGLKKAIKFVFGSLDESRANSELKALQRIRQVNHPFLLSLERIEIVDSQLLIVTELADGSLCDRYKKCREDGFIGIPRDQLLDYLRDAADALDFLCQKHDLQHLDIKPANMLLVADRVKVADFGLVKDIQSNSMSMLGGMTPTYAAPEMFDGRPGRFSDQYSLAIVYQELLTGTVPFGGRTTAQLASEHLHRAPNLDPVPPADRPILAKALAKKASQRYASCREFVEQLLVVGRERSQNGSDQSVSPEPLSNRNRQVAPKPESRPSDPQTVETGLHSSTHDFTPRDVEVLPLLDANKVAAAIAAPSLFIGLGRTGAEMLTGLRAELKRNSVDVEKCDRMTWLLIDTDSQCISESTEVDASGRMNHDSTLHLPLKPSQYYRECDEATFSPLSRRWLYNVPRSRTTEGVRPLAMLAFLDHAEVVHRAIKNYIKYHEELEVGQGDGEPNLSGEPNSNESHLRVYILASAHGGTGSCLLSEIGFLVRRELEERGLQGRIQAVVTVGEQNEQSGSDLRSASAVACLSELSHYIQSGGLHPGVPSIPPSQAVSKAPVDDVYLIHGGLLGDRAAWKTAIEQGVEYLLADAGTPIGSVLDEARMTTHQKERDFVECDWAPWLRTLCSRRIDFASRLSPEFVANLATFQVAQRWMARFQTNHSDWIAENNAVDTSNRQSLAQRKKILDQIDCMVSDLFREQRWSAQVWLTRCMDMLMQDQHVPIECIECSIDFPRSKLLEEEVVVEIERISDRLSIDLAQCKQDASNLLDQTLFEFQAWFNNHWRSSRPAWGYIASMVGLVSKRFREQGTSLRNISNRLRTEHDTLLEKIHSQETQASAEDTEVAVVELDRLEVQARLHDFAGRMLVRLGSYFDTIRDLWKAEATKLNREFGIFCVELGQELDFCVSPEGILEEPVMPVPAEWEPVRNEIDQAIEDQIESRISESLAVLWDATPIEKRDSVVSMESERFDSNPSSLGESNAVTVTLVRESTETIRLIDYQKQAIELAHNKCQGLGLIGSEPNSNDSENETITRRPTSIARQVRESSPPLLQWGGAKRNLLLLPLNCSEEVDVRWRSMFTESISIHRVPGLASPLVLCDGEQLILPEILQRMWRSVVEKQYLVNRIESRSDVDWLPVQI